jgi:hypothetical protein
MTVRQFSEDFEHPDNGWFVTGGAGFDFGKELSRTGQGNAWVRNTTGWNALNRWWAVEPHDNCYVNAWLRLSPDLTSGYIAVRNDKERRPDGNFDVINELKLVGPSDYREFTFEFNPGANPRVLFYIGLWGNGKDSWIQIDNVSLSQITPYPTS